MKTRKIVLTALAVLILAVYVYAATETETGPVVAVSGIAADWTYSGNCMTNGQDGKGVQYESMSYQSGADTGDVICIKEETDSGATILYRAFYGNNFTEYTLYLNGMKLRPVVDYSACSLSASHQLIFRIKR